MYNVYLYKPVLSLMRKAEILNAKSVIKTLEHKCYYLRRRSFKALSSHVKDQQFCWFRLFYALYIGDLLSIGLDYGVIKSKAKIINLQNHC